MKKSKAISLFLSNPLNVIKYGVKQVNEEKHKKNLRSTFGITQLPTINLMDLIPDGENVVFPYTFLSGTSSPTDILLLKSLAKRFDSCSYLEIGSWRGESIANVADCAVECLSVTLSEEEMKNMGFSEAFVKSHGIFSHGKENIVTIGANSHTFDFKSLNKQFDLIFVDGDHSYEGVLNDTKKVFDIRKDEHSIIVWHDYGLNPEDVRYSVLEAILNGIPPDKHKNLYHVSNTICAVYIESESFNTTNVQFPSFPDKVFTVSLKVESFKK